MPQHVTIVLEDRTVAKITTANCGRGNSYRISWQNKWLGEFDTGVATQRNASNRRADDKCDFTHARRGLAAAGAIASEVISELTSESTPFQSADIILSTNGHERSKIFLRAEDEDTLTMEMKIGTSGTSGFHPKTVFTHGPLRLPRPEAESRLEVVLLVIASQCQGLLNVLAKYKLEGSAQP